MCTLLKTSPPSQGLLPLWAPDTHARTSPNSAITFTHTTGLAESVCPGSTPLSPHHTCFSSRVPFPMPQHHHSARCLSRGVLHPPVLPPMPNPITNPFQGQLLNICKTQPLFSTFRTTTSSTGHLSLDFCGSLLPKLPASQPPMSTRANL